MNHQQSIQSSRSSRAHSIPPVTAQTIDVIEQLLADMVRGLREQAQAQPAAEPGVIEYDSWLRGARL